MLGVAAWSLATVATGLSRGALALFAARAAVGVGEASYATIAPTLIDEIATPAQKSRWMAIFNAAMPIGSALGYIVGGATESKYGWHTAFFFVGGPGVVAALLCLLIAEPVRRVARAVDRSRPARTLLAVPLYRRAVLGYCAYTFAIGGFAFWAPTYVFRRYGMEVGRASVRFGTLTLAGGFIGTLAGGWLADTLLRRAAARAATSPNADAAAVTAAAGANLRVCVISAGLGAPLALAAILAPNPDLFFILTLACEVALFLSSGPVNVVLLRSAPAALRASAMALAIFSIHALGDMWSPPIIGLLSERAALTSAMLVVPAFFALASFVWWRASAWLT
jgi:MFS family permease